MAATLKFVNPVNGNLLGFLPDHQGLQTQVELNGPGSIAFSYLNNGEKADVLDNDDALIYVIDDGVQRADVYLLEDDGDDPTDPAGDARLITVGGRGTLALLERAVIFPRGYSPGDSVVGLDPHFYFIEPDLDPGTDPTAVGFPTPGKIMLTLLARAHARGVIPYVTTDFDSDRDSAGHVWPEDYTVTYDAGTTLLTALQGMTDAGWCDAQMNGLTLQMYSPDTALKQDKPQQILRRGREVLSGPRKRSRRAIRSVMLAVGDEGAAALATDDAARLQYGRREGFLGEGGVTALDTLRRVVAKALSLTNKTSEGVTVSLDLSAGGPTPFVDYGIGDLIRYDQRRLNEREYEPMRVRTISTVWDDANNKQVSLELNDLFMERSVLLARQIDGIVNGSSNNTRPPTPPQGGKDRIAPKQPGSVSVSSDATVKHSGDVVASAVVQWPAVQLNEDNSVMDDFGRYIVQMQFPDRPNNDWTAGQVVHAPPVAYYQDLPPGERFKARVMCEDVNGNKSDWTESPAVTLADDAEPPPQPGAPTLQVVIGGLRVGWDGLGAIGQQMPVDFDRCEVHMSTDGVGFACTDATKVASLRTKGFVTITDLDADTTYYVRLVLVDHHGNASDPSPTAIGKPRRVVAEDLADKIIELGALADIERASITTSFLDTFASADARWVKRSGGGTQSWLTLPGSVSGNGVTQVTGPGLFEFNQNVPYDPDQFYRVQARVQILAAAAGAKMSFGVAGIAYDGVTRVSAANTTTGPDHFVAAYSDNPPAAGSWVTVQGFMTGRAIGASVPDEALEPRVHLDGTGGPRKVANGVRFMRPVFQFAGPSTMNWQIDQFTVEMLVIPPNYIGTEMVADATIVNAKIADLAVDDAKIGNLSVTKLLTGTMLADVVVGGSIRTTPSTTGTRVIMDGLGIRCYSADNTNTFLASAIDGSLTVQGELQTGKSGQAHVSIKANPEPGLDGPDRVAGIRLWTANVNEVQPAIIKNIWDDTVLANSVPSLSLTSGSRTNSTGEGARSILQIRGSVAASAQTEMVASTSRFTFAADTTGNPPNVYVFNAADVGVAGGNAPLTVGPPTLNRLLISYHAIQAINPDNSPAPIYINRAGANVELGGIGLTRANPQAVSQLQLLPANANHNTSIVFGQTDTVHVMNRPAVSYQFIKVQDIIRTDPGSAPAAAALGAAKLKAEALGDPVAEIQAMDVVDYTDAGRTVTHRTVTSASAPDIVVGGTAADPGVLVGALVATSIAAQQQQITAMSELTDRVTELEAELAALKGDGS